MSFERRARVAADKDGQRGAEFAKPWTRRARKSVAEGRVRRWSTSCYRSPAMRWGSWVVWGGVACTIALAPGVARAGTWAVRARWQRSSDASVVGYRIYTQHDGL